MRKLLDRDLRQIGRTRTPNFTSCLEDDQEAEIVEAMASELLHLRAEMRAIVRGECCDGAQAKTWVHLQQRAIEALKWPRAAPKGKR